MPRPKSSVWNLNRQIIMDLKTKGGYYTVLVKKSNLNVTASLRTFSEAPFHSENEDKSFNCILVCNLVDIYSFIIISCIGERNNANQHIKEGDILVAINGCCMGVLPATYTFHTWNRFYSRLPYPRLITFFRCDSNGSNEFIPKDVGITVLCECRIFYGIVLCIKESCLGVTYQKKSILVIYLIVIRA